MFSTSQSEKPVLPGCQTASIERLTLGKLWTRPLPHLDGDLGTRLICRGLLSMFRHRLIEASGVEYIQPEHDPFIVVMNHSQRPEAILVPTWMCFLRHGRLVHFMADWNFLMIPVIGGIIRRHDPIVVTRKSAKPRFLNRFKSRFQGNRPPFEEARHRIEHGRSVGIFPEGTTNRHPSQLLQGYHGAAQLALQTGVPVVPAGIRFPHHTGPGPISDRESLSLRFGPPVMPERMDGRPPGPDAIREFHEQIMTVLSTLCGKEWQRSARRTKYALDQE